MFSNIIITLILLVLTTFVLAKYIKLPRNIWLLFMAQPLAMAASPIILFIGAILSTSMASDPSLVTLPITMMILGVASTSIPAALIAKKKGRKEVCHFHRPVLFTYRFNACTICNKNWKF